jgi:hypothetical protein
MKYILLFIFCFWVYSNATVDDSTKHHSLNLRIDFATNSVGNKTLTYYLTKYTMNQRIYCFSIGPQYNIIKTKKNKTIVKGGFLDFGKEIFRIVPSRDILGNINANERFHLNFYFLRTGINYFMVFKRNFGFGGELFLKYIIYDKSPISSPEFYYQFVENNTIPHDGLISYLTGVNLKYLDLTTSVFMGYQMKRSMFLFKINFPHFIEEEWFSWGLTYMHSIYYGRKK